MITSFPKCCYLCSFLQHRLKKHKNPVRSTMCYTCAKDRDRTLLNLQYMQQEHECCIAAIDKLMQLDPEFKGKSIEEMYILYEQKYIPQDD